jgi:hypothetical protein
VAAGDSGREEPRHNPFETPGLLSWLLTPEPHRGYRGIPVVPLGSRLAFSPRGLCAKPDNCGGLAMTSGGQVRFRDDKGVDRIAVRLHRSTLRHIFALTPSGELFALAEGKPQVWRQVALPAPRQPPACLTSLILVLRCRQCGGQGPLPRLVGLSRFAPASPQSRPLSFPLA